jgi:hypothetical protein
MKKRCHKAVKKKERGHKVVKKRREFFGVSKLLL